MSQTGDVEQLEELEPLDEGMPIPATGPMVTPVSVTGGLPAPAYNPAADKEYYRFLFAGIIMLLGCLMPFGPQPVAGYMTIRGALFMIIALGIVWSSWASIHNRRMVKGMLRWVMLAILPFAIGIVDMMVAFNEGSAVAAWIAQGGQIKSWGDFFGNLGNMLAPNDQVGQFIQHYGPGRLMVFGAAILAELFMVLAVMGGAKKIKEQKAERRASAGGRRRS